MKGCVLYVGKCCLDIASQALIIAGVISMLIRPPIFTIRDGLLINFLLKFLSFL